MRELSETYARYGTWGWPQTASDWFVTILLVMFVVLASTAVVLAIKEINTKRR